MNSVKLPGDPWNNRWSSFYGIAWNFSMEFHRKCPNPPWKMSMQKFPWNSMEIGALMFSMEFHGKCPNPPCKYFPWKSMEKFPWNSMEIDVLILHGIPWRFFTQVYGAKCDLYGSTSSPQIPQRGIPHRRATGIVGLFPESNVI